MQRINIDKKKLKNNIMWPKKKKLVFYTVSHKDEPNRNLTIVSSLKDAIEYSSQSIKWDHIDHFNSWCQLRNLDNSDERVWNKYLRTCVSRAECDQYQIATVKYNYDFVSAMLRMLAVCPPVGCSYETENECNYFETKFNTELNRLSTLDLIKKELEELKTDCSVEKINKIEEMVDTMTYKKFEVKEDGE